MQRPEIINSQPTAIKLLLNETYEVMLVKISSCLTMNFKKIFGLAKNHFV